METKMIKINDVIIEKELYPRNKIEGYHNLALTYMESMKAGNTFPPVCVAVVGKKYYLVDGLHRLKAKRMIGEKFTTCEVLKNLTKEQIFLEAVKRNVSHGQPLSFYDKLNVMRRLEKDGLKPTQISSILHITTNTIKKYSGKNARVVISSTGKEVMLKPGLKHLRGTESELTEKEINSIQDNSAGLSQIEVLSTTIKLVENNLIDFKNPIVKRLFTKLKKIILLTEE